MTKTTRIGDITIERVIEQEARFFKAREFFPSLSADCLEENRHWLQPIYLDPVNDGLVLSIQSHVVRTRHKTILIDSCVGNHKPRPSLPAWSMLASQQYEASLAQAGLGFGDIDIVMCTHLHIDHVGWNTRLANGRWAPTFPNARYVFAAGELAFWQDRHRTSPELCPWITDSVLPIIAANRADVVSNDHAVDDEICLVPTPGHTIDHVSVLVGRPGADALITGDMMHSPLQGRYPELGMRADHDTALGGRTRRSIFERTCDTSTVLCTAHFPEPSAARVRRWGDGFRFEDA